MTAAPGPKRARAATTLLGASGTVGTNALRARMQLAVAWATLELLVACPYLSASERAAVLANGLTWMRDLEP